jgi:hypothetical protein
MRPAKSSRPRWFALMAPVALVATAAQVAAENCDVAIGFALALDASDGDYLRRSHCRWGGPALAG